MYIIKVYFIFIAFLLLVSEILFLSFADAATYTYDPLLRITRANYTNGFSEEYTYDPAGNRLTVSITSRQISGNGYAYPDPGSRADISVEIRASSPETGRFSYYYTKSGITLLSTLITSLMIDGSSAVITGKCTLNGISGFSYMAFLSDNGPDTVEINVYNPDGTVYFSTNSNILVSGDLSIETETIDQHKLITSVIPSDSGTISPDCSYGCLYESGISVIITANENSGYTFINWNGCDSASNNICIMTINSDRNAEAVYRACPDTVRIAGADPIYYPSIQSAYDDSMDGDIIQVRGILLHENINIDRGRSVTLHGGFDCTYENSTGKTRIDGTISVSSGTVTIGSIVIK